MIVPLFTLLMYVRICMCGCMCGACAVYVRDVCAGCMCGVYVRGVCAGTGISFYSSGFLYKIKEILK